jgi:osomolarity two-component system response regulator SKN7
MNTEVRFNTTGPESVGVLEPAPVGSASALKAGPRSGVVQPPTATDANPANLLYPKEDGETEPVACSIGTTVGISAVHSAHMNNASYPNSSEQELGCTCGQVPDKRIKSGNIDPGWVRSPRILLVEDDATCRQIGSKFLHSFSCVIDTALDGLEAVHKIQQGSKYDLILMDIIMPNLDGVSACHLIRQSDRTPIIALTSNIRSDDIQLYFEHGMNDVLPKPFTRKSLLDILERHLYHLKAIQQGIKSSQTTATS